MNKQYIDNIKEQQDKLLDKNIPQLNELFLVTEHTLISIKPSLSRGQFYEINNSLFRIKEQLKLFKNHKIFGDDKKLRCIYSYEDLFRLASLVVGIDFVAMQVIKPENLIDFIIDANGNMNITDITKG